jgi:hypothetical protein
MAIFNSKLLVYQAGYHLFDPLEMVDLMMFPVVDPLEMGNLTDLTGKYWRYCNPCFSVFFFQWPPASHI